LIAENTSLFGLSILSLGPRWYTMAVQRIERSGLDYQAFFCEENVWRLLARPEFAEMASWAVIVANLPRDVVLLRQLAGRPVDGLIHWEYHVFAVLAEPMAGRVALDLDSELPFPCALGRYLEDTFPEGVQRAFSPRFRVMRGSDYVRGLSSDRSHMRKADGSWLAPPPPWPAPGSLSGLPCDFMEWIDVGRRLPGVLYDAARMAAFATETGS
jgi:protein N-terminal glutamine amidohydrolase